MEVVKTQQTELQQNDKVKIYGVKIRRDAAGCFEFSVVHSGPFKFQDYDELELKANAVKMVRRAY